MDKNQAVIDFLLTCPAINSNPLFFNFLNAKDKAKQLVTIATDNSINRQFIDGSELKRYQFSLVDFCSVVNQAIPRVTITTTTSSTPTYVSENVEDMNMVQGIIDWIKEQADARNYPNFGDTCVVDDMRTTTDTPNLNGVDTQGTPSLAKYSITVQIDYLDISKVLWNSTGGN